MPDTPIMKKDHHCKILYTFSMLNKVYATEYNKQFLSTSGALKFQIYKFQVHTFCHFSFSEKSSKYVKTV